MTSVLLALAMILPPAGIVSVHRMKVTAYDAGCSVCCGKWASNMKTATGSDASKCDGVAAAWNVMLPGTVLDIPGVGIRAVDDTGGAMRQSARKQIAHIDVRMKTHAEARAWGVRWLDVAIVRHGRRGRK